MIKDFFLKPWRGQTSVRMLFWLYGILFLGLISAGYLVLEKLTSGTWVFLTYQLILLPGFLWLAICFWRCAYHQETGRWYGHLLRGAVVVVVLALIANYALHFYIVLGGSEHASVSHP